MTDRWTEILHDIVEASDLFTLVLLEYDEFSHLPEINSLIGSTRLVQFLDLFGGQSIYIPTRDEVKEAATCVRVFQKIRQGIPSADVAVTYDLDEDDVLAIYARLRVLYERNLGNPNG
jgi:Mor family transcriptional regulator